MKNRELVFSFFLFSQLPPPCWPTGWPTGWPTRRSTATTSPSRPFNLPSSARAYDDYSSPFSSFSASYFFYSVAFCAYRWKPPLFVAQLIPR